MHHKYSSVNTYAKYQDQMALFQTLFPQISTIYKGTFLYLQIENENLIAHASHVEEIPPEEARSETSEVESYEEEESCGYCMIKLPIYALIWLGLYAYFLYLQFGAVFFVISVLIGIYINTRTRPRKKGEVSAYSVFNEDCASIDGTLTPEQFEREIRYGAGTVRSF